MSGFARVLAVVVLLAGLSGTTLVGVSAPAGAAGLNADEAFVTAAYQDFLGRYPTPTELATATAVPLSTGAARANVVRVLSTSPEWIRVTVNKLYADTLGRPGDTGGVNYWIGKITSGRMSVANVAASFYSSTEYFVGFGESVVRTWVLDLYTKVLLRSGASDPSGVNYWGVCCRFG